MNNKEQTDKNFREAFLYGMLCSFMNPGENEKEFIEQVEHAIRVIFFLFEHSVEEVKNAGGNLP